ncbi:MAG TPA: DinB family protein, partial [Chloroflexota bacterium]|nr:DinB family protein [Chloroflexota bacterium]
MGVAGQAYRFGDAHPGKYSMRRGTIRGCMHAEELAAMLCDARTRTLALVADLTDQQMLGPQLQIVNPPLWEIGHVAWFQEKWAWRHLRGREPHRENMDALYDSAAIPHDVRWELPLPSRQDTLALMQTVLDDVLEE